ncbi:hypothetical protein ED236_00505 [Pseudomethylobacillus aquaticus]|uniref:Uncharacterized protein n=1 Tax=Pseudomethylobacillus aquaticus TaxID=2676064 RepID=A0A3N0V5G7_9PROT|nr:hypothetical protein ED236_00505 [Pseudomethylobacillus aquaticus]
MASATFVTSAVVDNTTNDPLDLLITLEVTPGSVASNKQVLLYAKASLDNTNYQSGPESGTTATDEPNLTLIGALPCNTNSTLQRGVFSVSGAFGGALPPYLKFVIKNETGAALAGSGNALKVAEVTGEVV